MMERPSLSLLLYRLCFARSRVELRPMLADDWAVAGEGVAAVDEARAPVLAAAGGGHLLGDVFPHRLIGDGRHGPQHLDLMGATLDAAEALLQPAAPAGADLEAPDGR